ncbi:MAG: hypothetical protein CL526_07875 [Aequorivita sp.]|nr:hypothetical protein [Aequorivita sp.]|tara:strand:- start:10568 stop:10987 length:420 start_codon:yes stop_codon:yes gene_type:complete
MKMLKHSLAALVVGILFSCNGKAQNEQELIGTWEIQGTLMGDNGEGWLMPHNQANPDCEADHTVFAEDNTASEVRYNKNCDAKEKSFSWKREGDHIILTSGDRTVDWLIHSIEGDKMTVGVQMRPNAKNRMYAVYKKQE